MERDKLRDEEQDVAARSDKKDEAAQLHEKDDEQVDKAELYGTAMSSIQGILGESPGFDVPDSVPRELRGALELLYSAKTAVQESIGAGHVSGIARMRALNLALANLRPVLSAGLKPGQDDQARVLLGEQVTELRHEIKQTIYKEAVPRLKRKPEIEEEAAGDEEDGPDDLDEEADG